MTTPPIGPVARTKSAGRRGSRWKRGRAAAWITGSYLAVVAGTFGFVMAAISTSAQNYLASIYLIMVTAPLSFVFTALLPTDADNLPPEWVFYAALVGAGVLQALGLWLAIRGRRVR